MSPQAHRIILRFRSGDGAFQSEVTEDVPGIEDLLPKFNRNRIANDQLLLMHTAAITGKELVVS